MNVATRTAVLVFVLMAQGHGQQFCAWDDVMGGPTGPVRDFATWDDGSGSALYVAGFFQSAGGGAGTRHLARWDGSMWSSIGGGVGSGAPSSATSVCVFDDGGGEDLYVAGAFSTPGSNIARWDGTTWSTLGVGLDGPVITMEVYDDGTGPALYVGGDFQNAGGLLARGFAKWDGTNWSAPPMAGPRVFDLKVFDDGNGPALFAAGSFAVTASISGVARWDGSSWSNPGGFPAFSYNTRALEVFDDGNGPALYLGGFGVSFSGGPTITMAKWDGTVWTELAGGAPDPGSASATNIGVTSLLAMDDGGGERLFAAGSFTNLSDGAPAAGIAAWDGSNWEGVGGGVIIGSNSSTALAAFDSGQGLELYLGGSMFSIGGEPFRFLGRWACNDAILNPATGHRYMLTPPLASFEAARDRAVRMGGYLASVSNAPEQAFLETQFASIAGERFWIGLADQQTEGVFRLDSGETLGAAFWAAGEPANLSGFEDAAVWEVTGVGSAEWRAVPDMTIGSQRYRGLVEIPAVPNVDFKKVMITEVTWGSPDGLELTNFSSNPVDLSNHVITWNDGSAPTTSSPLGIIMAPGEIVTVSEFATPFPGSPPGVRHLQPFSVLHGNLPGIVVGLQDGSGNSVDEVVISDYLGADSNLPRSGTFRGLALRGTIATYFGQVGVERIWGLDTDSGADWTEQPNLSLGYVNRNSGPRGTDPLPVPTVVINEVDWLGGRLGVELFNAIGPTTSLHNWFLITHTSSVGAGPGCFFSSVSAQEITLPFSSPLNIDAASFVVLNRGAPSFGQAAWAVSVPWMPMTLNPCAPSELALFDVFGRNVDMLRTTGQSQRVFNGELAPHHWSDFTGAVESTVPQSNVSRKKRYSSTIGGQTALDSNTGTDFGAPTTQTLGALNSSVFETTYESRLDVRFSRAPSGPASGDVIINAGVAHAGSAYGIMLSLAPDIGTGPFYGLGFDSINNFITLSSYGAPYFSTLDAEGSARYGWSPGVIPVPLQAIFMTWDGAGYLDRTYVLYYEP